MVAKGRKWGVNKMNEGSIGVDLSLPGDRVMVRKNKLPILFL